MPQRPPQHRLLKLSKNHDASLRHLLVGGVSRISGSFSSAKRFPCQPKALWAGALTRKLGLRIRDEGMTASLKRKSHRAAGRASGGCDNTLELIADLASDRPVDRGMRPIRLAVDDGRPRIRGGANRHVQRDLAQKRHAKPLGLVPWGAVTEDVRFGAAMRALEIAHVLDNAENRHIDLLEHREPPPRVDQG